MGPPPCEQRSTPACRPTGTARAWPWSASRQDCELLCAQRGWDVVAVLVDNDMSATSGKRRPGFEEALRLLADGTVDVLVSWHLDRLQRTPKDLERLLDAAQVEWWQRRHGAGR